jgi:hypothetical protein
LTDAAQLRHVLTLDPDDLSAAEFYPDEASWDAQQSIDRLEKLLAWGANQDAAYQQPITTYDLKKAINLRTRLQRVRQKMSVASATDITSGPERRKTLEVGEETGILTF